MVIIIDDVYIRREPFRSIYVQMTEVLEESVEAQGRGDVFEATLLCEHASVLGKAIKILARRASPGAIGES